jgi:hypothetical protein
VIVMSKGNRARIVALAFVGAFVVAGCSEVAVGTPQATTETPSSTTGKGPGTATTSKPAAGSVDSLAPCELLTSADLARLGVPAGKPSLLGANKTCTFQASGKFTASITLSPKLGLADLNTQGFEVSPTQVGKRQARKALERARFGACEIDMAVTEKSSAGVTVANNASTDPELACPTAMEIAKTIEPKLP